LGGFVSLGGRPFGQFLAVTLASSDITARIALRELPPGGQPVLSLDCVFALAYALVLSLAAADLAPHSATPGTGRLLAKAIWVGAAADIAENVMLLRLLEDPEAVSAALLRAAAVLKFGIFVAACGWVGGAAWKAKRRLWSLLAIASAGLVGIFLFPALLGS
jgi:hypothetical protein